jgi:NADH:ubiquinone oxidoreductase subunit 5 (subunit L)/multisubunit Na+/H+ antiporter MnhA subunit
MRLLHMLFHSFFKSMLFLTVGRFILEGRGSQDFRFSQKLKFNRIVNIPLTTRLLCLTGFPFLLGFFSKDLILQELGNCSMVLTYTLFFIRCILTLVYRIRMVTNLTKFINNPTTSIIHKDHR